MSEPLEAPSAAYCRFGKRDLDKLSFLYPLLNNRFGDLLNIELRHEQLFFIANDRVIEDVGYSETEKGKRFSEAEYGKPIRALTDLARYGYWLVGRAYAPEIMKEALRRQQDGYYYSVFSNQCQDWADRLKRLAERIERERGMAPPGHGLRGLRAESELPALPTEPASIWMGFVALALGVGGFFTPEIAGGAFTVVLGAFFVASGVSHAIYGFHARDWRNLLPELVTALINLAAGLLMLLNRDLARTAGSVIVAATFAIHGSINVFLGIFSRPRSHWIGKIVAGVVMLAGAAVAAAHWPASGERTLGVIVGLSLFAGGIGTIVLSWMTRTRRENVRS